jgi:hypothetical protein
VPGAMMPAAIGFDWLCRIVFLVVSQIQDRPLPRLYGRNTSADRGRGRLSLSRSVCQGSRDAQAFNGQYVEIADQFNGLPASQPRFVVVAAGCVGSPPNTLTGPSRHSHACADDYVRNSRSRDCDYLLRKRPKSLRFRLTLKLR